MRIELHCHSTYSDGSVAARDLAGMAASRNVELFCLTDHDTVAGYEETADVLAPGCTVLRGLELSCHDGGRNIHLLIYAVQDGPGLDALQKCLVEVGRSRRERIVTICERLGALGITLDPQPLLNAAHGRTPGRPDIAHALVAQGVCKRPAEAFQRFLRDDGPAYVPASKITLEQGLELGKATGARMSLAHPHTVGNFDLVRDLFVRLRASGLEGIEALYGRYGRAAARPWLQLAQEQDLVVTAGSDFHGTMVPEVSRPVVDLPAPHATRLCQWLGVAA